MRKGKVSLICMILVLIFITVSLFGTWYGYSMTTDSKYDIAMSLTSTTSVLEKGNKTQTQTVSNADIRKSSEVFYQDTSIFDIFDNTLYLTIFAFIIAILSLMFLIGYLFNFRRPSIMKNLTMIFGIITFILAFAAVFYFMIGFLSKINSLSTIQTIPDIGFWNNYSEGSNSMSMGPGFAWYLMLTVGLIALISVIFVFMDKQAGPVSQNPTS